MNGRPSGGWAITPWVWQSAMACVPSSSPALQNAGCQIAGQPNTGQKVKPWLDCDALFPWTCVPWEQVKECAIGGAASFCSQIYANAGEAEDFATKVARLGPTAQNAIQHAYWFALNRFDLDGFSEVGVEGTLRTFGRDHEADWRDSYLDARKDEANNSIGILIGAQAVDLGLPREQIGAWVVENRHVLFCVSNSGDQAYGVPIHC